MANGPTKRPSDASIVPPELKAAIGRDLRAVQPLARPAIRALGLIPLAIVLLFADVGVFGLREDAPQLGFGLTWFSSTLQMILGLVLAAAALREAVPGTRWPSPPPA